MTPSALWSHMLKNAPITPRELGERDTGRATYYLADHNRDTMNALDKFAMLAEACGYVVMVRGHGEALRLDQG